MNQQKQQDNTNNNNKHGVPLTLITSVNKKKKTSPKNCCLRKYYKKYILKQKKVNTDLFFGFKCSSLASKHQEKNQIVLLEPFPFLCAIALIFSLDMKIEHITGFLLL